MARTHDLTAVLRSIAKAHTTTETKAAGILAVFREWSQEHQQPLTSAVVDDLIAEAYDRCGWSQRIGRPREGDVPAPVAVKVYLSTVRAGMRLGVDVLACETMQELRNAIKAARIKESFKSAEKAAQASPALVGVSIQSPGTLTGALLHDIYVVRASLEDEGAAALDAQLHKLLTQYIKKAPTLRLVA